MSDFFDSEIIQEELSEINEMQEKIYESFITFGRMSREQKLEHVEILSSLLEKQQVMALLLVMLFSGSFHFPIV